MKINEAIQKYKNAINKNYSIDEVIDVLSKLKLSKRTICNIVSLVCDQPERSKREDPLNKMGCGALNSMET
jgi:hypothetical protein